MFEIIVSERRIYMKSYACTKCGSVDVFIKDRGNQKALICGDCCAWLKWIGKAELPLVERYIESNSDIEKVKINIFKKELNSSIQRLSLAKEEVIKIVESLYR